MVAASAGCAGGAAVPAGEHVAPPAGIFSGADRAGKACANTPNIWDFKGSCTSGSFGTQGQRISLKPYRGVTLVFTVPVNRDPSKATFISADATGSGDVTGKFNGRSFVPYGQKTCVKGVKCPGHSIVYFLFVDRASFAISIRKAPAIAVTSDKVSGPNCLPARWTAKGWQPFLESYNPPKRHTVVLSPPLLGLPEGAIYFDVVCL